MAVTSIRSDRSENHWNVMPLPRKQPVGKRIALERSHLVRSYQIYVFLVFWILLLFTESSVALERALLQSAARVSNFYVLYHGCFLTPCIEVCSKVSGNGCVLK